MLKTNNTICTCHRGRIQKGERWYRLDNGVESQGNDREVGEPMAEGKLIRYQLKMLTLCEWVKFCRNLYDTWRARLVLGSRYVNQ